MTLRRIQRRRTKGYRLPPGALCVTRGTKWGNPFKVDDCGRDGAVRAYRADLEAMSEIDLAEFREPLRSATALACWCRLDQDRLWRPE